MSILKNKFGFSILEIILVLAILGTLVGLVTTYYTNSQVRADINTQASSIAYYLRLASSNASSGLNNADHGVHFENSAYTIFQGNPYNPADTANFQINLPDTITINNISLNGGGQDVIFSKANGETTNYGTISLNATNIGKTVTITINSAGIINY